MDKRAVARSMNEILDELKAIENAKSGRMSEVAHAISWGYVTGRTNYTVESRLYFLSSLDEMVEEIAGEWDGQDSTAGALYVAQRFYSDTIW